MQINTTSDALDNLNKKLGGADIEIEPSTNKVDALKKIYKTLGGTDDVAGLSTVYQVLEKITEVAEGGGGSGTFYTVSNSEDSTINLNIAVSADASTTERLFAEILLDAGNSMKLADDYYYLVRKEFTTAEGSVEEVEIDGDQWYLITGDASFLIED